MAEVACPECGSLHLCGRESGATTRRNLAQPPGANRRKSDASPESAGFAHGSEVLEPSTRKGQSYNLGYEPAFEKFWSIYPLHRDKRKAQKAWRNAIHRASATDINAGATRYRNDPNRLAQYTKYAEGWLNGDGWEDEPLPPRLRPGVIPAPIRQSPEEIAAEIAALGAEVE